MPDAFVPLVPPKLKPGGNGAPAPAPSNGPIAPFVQTPAPAAAKPASTDNAPETDHCAKPFVTLKKEGNTVTGIRVECGCGRVLELECVY